VRNIEKFKTILYSGNIGRNIDKICEKLEWTEDLLEVQMENELGIKDR